MTDKLITEIVDTYLKDAIDSGVNKLPGVIAPEMQDPSAMGDSEWKTWMPINSKATDKEIAELEVAIGHKLPVDYIFFLKYKHFCELYIGEARMCRHPVNTWQASLNEMIFNGNPREFLIDKGFIPFADMSDWGLLCFDTNRGYLTANYPIVLWDHESPDWNKDYAPSFRMALRRLDKDFKKMQETD
jgi:hypothetical protein